MASHRMVADGVKDSREVPGRSFSTRIRRRLASVLALPVLLAVASPAAHAAEKISICFGAVASALISIAKQQEFFAAEGVDAELHPFPSGKQAMEAMFVGKCALAAAETPVVHHSLGRKDFSIVATIATSDGFERIIVRADRGINSAADLRGRRVAVPQYTTAHYFLDTYLVTNGVAPRDVVKIYLPAPDVAQAFRRGEVDAAAHWEPNIQVLATELGARTKALSTPGLHVSPFLLVGGREYLRQNRAVVEHVLLALIRAERFVKDQPLGRQVGEYDFPGALATVRDLIRQTPKN